LCGVFAKDLLELAKVRITAAVTLTTALGYVLVKPEISSALLAAALGTFLLACGSAALNQIQDCEIDRRMERTRRRPLPSGRLSMLQAGAAAALLTLAGAALLHALLPSAPLALGLLTMAWYNLAYTYLKRVSPLAVIPGALCGALPPLIGWSAAGGELLDLRALALALFFFMWQIPHFWVLLLIWSRDYAAAGLPTLEELLNASQIKRVTFVWLTAAALCGALLPLCGIGGAPWFLWLYLTLAAAVLAGAARALWVSADYRRLFAEINLFVLAAAALLFAGEILFPA
jgi:heme o synthase